MPSPGALKAARALFDDGMTFPQLAEIFDVHIQTVKHWAQKDSWPLRKNVWTKEEDEAIMSGKFSVASMSIKFGRTPNAIYQRRCALRKNS